MIATVAPVSPTIAVSQKAAKAEGNILPRQTTELSDTRELYHRKDGKIVDRRDDIHKATSYAVMMKRYAVAPGSIMTRNIHAPTQSISSMRL